MSSCTKCGRELKSGAGFCGGCGSAVAPQTAGNAGAVRKTAFEDEPLGITDSDREEMFGKLSNKWAWALVVVCACATILQIAGIMGIWVVSLPADRFMVVAFIFNIVFWLLDVGELKAKGYKGRWQWFGLLIIPVYLFIRAAKTTQKYTYAIVYASLFVLVAWRHILLSSHLSWLLPVWGRNPYL
jgi:hypothetical protein